MASTARPTLAALRAGMRQLWRSPAGRVGLVLVGALVGLALLAPVLQPFEPETARNYAARLEPPSGRHWFGTDSLGRDVLTLVWYGVRTSLLMGPLSVALGLVAGTLLGLIAGYFRGAIEVVVGWLTDILLAFPAILLAITIVTLAGPSLAGAMVAVGVVQVPIFIRLTRSMVLSLREREFVVAARAQGAGSARVLFRHLLPASLGPIVVQATLSVGTATLEAAGLGFLGLGAQPPTPEVGTMLADAFRGGYALSAPWTMLFPGAFITAIVLAFNLLGDGLRDMLDP
ncbi:MAG: peptide ABC transporter permease [Cyanobacteria bacterium QS_8_64_29]|nr:MAG: peptide ABC transporter permease [Cyanobacteria bacterium QS_8_64_29]